MTQHCLGSTQFDLEDDVSYKCSCCEADGTQWKRTRNLTTKKPSVLFSSLTGADINFFKKSNTDLCELQQNTWAPLPKALVVDSGAGGNRHASGLVDKPSFDRIRSFKRK